MPREELSPSDQISTVHKCTLFMEIVEDPILLSPVGEVSMPGYAAIDEQYHIEPMQIARTAFTAIVHNNLGKYKLTKTTTSHFAKNKNCL
jgi:hypothetical protein